MNITQSSFPLSILPLYWCEENNCLKTELSFLGTLIEDSAVACGIADGLIDPVSKLPFNLPEIIERPMSGSSSSGNSIGLGAAKSSNNNGFKRATTTSSTSVSYFKQGNNNRNSNNQSKQQRGSISSHFNKLTQPAVPVVSRSTSLNSASTSSSSSAVSFFQANAGSTSAATINSNKIGSKGRGTNVTTNSSSVSRVSIIQALRNGTYHSALSLSSAASGLVTPSSSGKPSQSSAQTPMTNERVSRYFSALGDTDTTFSNEVKIMPSLSSLVTKTSIEVIEIDLDEDDDDNNNDHHLDVMDVYQAVEEEEHKILQEASTMNVVRQDDGKADKIEREEDEVMSDKVLLKRKLQSSTKVSIPFYVMIQFYFLFLLV